MENADWSSISQWWIPATNNNNLWSLAQRELWDRMKGTRRGTGCPSGAGRKERGSIWVWVWVSTTLLSFIIACQMHILPYIVELIVGSPAPLYAQQPFRQPLHTDTSTDPRQRVGRQTGSWKASSHVDGSWFAVRLMGHISHFLRFRLFNGHGVSWRRSPLSVHCPMPIPVYGYWFLL